MQVRTQISSEGPDKTRKAFAFVSLLVSFLWLTLAFSPSILTHILSFFRWQYSRSVLRQLGNAI